MLLGAALPRETWLLLQGDRRTALWLHDSQPQTPIWEWVEDVPCVRSPEPRDKEPSVGTPGRDETSHEARAPPSGQRARCSLAVFGILVSLSYLQITFSLGYPEWSCELSLLKPPIQTASAP